MLSLKIIFLSNIYGHVKHFQLEIDKGISYQKLEKKMNIGRLGTTNLFKHLTFLRKLRTIGSIERTVMIDFKCCFMLFLVLPGSVETQTEVINFVNSL